MFVLGHTTDCLDSSNDNHRVDSHKWHWAHRAMKHKNFSEEFDKFDQNNLLDKGIENFDCKVFECRYLDFRMDLFDMDQLEFRIDDLDNLDRLK